MSDLAREVDALSARQAERIAKRARLLARRAFYRRRVAAFQACFLDDDGALTPSGRIVLAHMGVLAGLGKARKGRNADDIQFDEGARFIVLDTIDNLTLDHAKLARIAHQLRENEND
jgi:hypothetical protein